MRTIVVTLTIDLEPTGDPDEPLPRIDVAAEDRDYDLIAEALGLAYSDFAVIDVKTEVKELSE
jgi:hypothetical protein